MDTVTNSVPEATEAARAAKTAGFFSLSPTQFALNVAQIEGQNIRQDLGDIAAFADEIIAAGRIFDPVEIRKPTKVEQGLLPPFTSYVVNGDGSRRHAAVRYIVAELKKGDVLADIPVTVAKDTSNSTRILRMLITGGENGKKPLHAIEEADGIHRLVKEEKKTAKQVAKLLGRSEGHVKARMALLAAPDEVRAAVDDPRIGLSLAESIAVRKKGKPEEQLELLKEAKKSKEGRQAVQRKLGLRGKAAKIAETNGNGGGSDDADNGGGSRKIPEKVAKLVREAMATIEGTIEAVNAPKSGYKGKRLKDLEVDPLVLSEFVAKDYDTQIAFAWGRVCAAMELNGVKDANPWQVAEGEA